MANKIQVHMELVLQNLASVPHGKLVEASTLQEMTALPTEDLRNAVEMLAETGLVKALKTLDAGQVGFASVWITPSGRYEYENILSQTKIDTGANTAVEATDKNRNVFVVHGRNAQAKQAVEEFLRAIGLWPIEWPEARSYTGNANPMTHEIVTAAFERARAVVILLSPEDLAYLHPTYLKMDDPEDERTPTGQPRQNVLFELGMAMGRDQNRTVLIQFGKLRTFTDIEGRNVVRMDNSVEKRKELAQRLESAGCSVNLIGDAWLKAGDFIVSTPKAELSTYQRSRPITEEEKDILSLIAINNEDREGFDFRSIDAVSQINKWPKLKVDHILNELEGFDLVFNSEDGYFLTEKGIKYVVENDLIDHIEKDEP